MVVSEATLDVYVAAQLESRRSRPEAIGFLLRDSLTGPGDVPAGDDAEIAN